MPCKREHVNGSMSAGYTTAKPTEMGKQQHLPQMLKIACPFSSEGGKKRVGCKNPTPSLSFNPPTSTLLSSAPQMEGRGGRHHCWRTHYSCGMGHHDSKSLSHMSPLSKAPLPFPHQNPWPGFSTINRLFMSNQRCFTLFPPCPMHMW